MDLENNISRDLKIKPIKNENEILEKAKGLNLGRVRDRRKLRRLIHNELIVQRQAELYLALEAGDYIQASKLLTTINASYDILKSQSKNKT